MTLETRRLILRHLNESDATFLNALYNTDGFLTFVGDKNIRSDIDAAVYLRSTLLPMYKQDYMGLMAVEEKGSGKAIGICGLIKRDTLDDIDLGYGFFPAFQRQGYAKEAAEAVIQLARETLAVPQIVAITHPTNNRSISLLEKLAFKVQSQGIDDPELILLKLTF
ncbi:GNAT family N-acetyltransferase [Enterovibrio nigricans]|uniref:Protein N-acetyltransferase, RimJ/RimL family n=1 Tax=Enterovibrio nigricans DSM 22720 TaxID=1121868 RepID=A0A1T4VAZ9_9GAMM|nr:GNAT family N-acetyltransferase [Enterovibrio nigricans]SKA62073.1 Protein N-acetyltransferase, RimJ/RimL family [Enterovibrio nigricans DSM 22720]